MAQQRLTKQRLILTDTRWVGSYGIGRFAQEVVNRLPNLKPLGRGFAPYPFHRFDIAWILWQLLRHRPHLYFSPGFNPPIWSPVPFVFTLYDLILLRFPQEANRLMQSYFRFVLRPATQRAKFILTCSEFSRQEIIAWAKVQPEKVIVVGCGVDDTFSPQGALHTPGYPYLLYVGNHVHHKNLHRLMAAFATAKLDPQIRLVLSGSPKPDLIQQIAALKLEDRVVFAGLISDAELPSYYRGAIAFLFPSLYEGFGLPPIEAMACGTPVLTSNVTSLPEVVGDAALLVNPYDVDAIARGIECLVQDRVLRQELVRRGLIQAKQHTWEKTAELTLAILEQAMRDPSERPGDRLSAHSHEPLSATAIATSPGTRT
jgi:glycosyltransferase involved in cell wall biosynthesis